MHKIQCAYFGFQSEEEAKNFASYIGAKYSARAIARESERTNTPWEAKVWEFSELLPIVLHCAGESILNVPPAQPTVA